MPRVWVLWRLKEGSDLPGAGVISGQPLSLLSTTKSSLSAEVMTSTIEGLLL